MATVEISPHSVAETRCLSCGVQLLDRDHLDWCSDKVWRRGAIRRQRTRAELADLLSRLADRPTIGALRRVRTANDAQH
jgi:hypothetical protein